MKPLVIGSYLLTLMLFLTSCGNSSAKVEEKQEKAKAEKTEAKPSEATESPDYVELTDDQMKAIGIQLGSMEQRGINTSIKVNGMLEVPNQYKAMVTSLTTGSIRSLLIRPGSYVRKGQTIATIANPELVSVQQQFLNVNSRIGLAELEYERQKTLVAGNAGARKNLQQAETELRTLRTEKMALQKQLSTLGISPSRVASGNITSTVAVGAPVSGTVSKVIAQIGSYIDASTVIAEIVNNAQLQVKLLVYEKDLPQVHLKQTIQFALTNNPQKQYEATVNSIGSAFEGGSTAIPVRAVVKGNKAGLIDSMGVTAMLNIGNVTVPSVPNDAIVNYQGQDYIFVQMENKNEATTEKAEKGGTSKIEENAKKQENSNGKNDPKEQNEKAREPRVSFKRVKVAKGSSSLGFTEVNLLEEIPANSKIIIKGAFFALGKMTNAGEEGE